MSLGFARIKTASEKKVLHGSETKPLSDFYILYSRKKVKRKWNISGNGNFIAYILMNFVAYYFVPRLSVKVSL